MRDSFNNMKGGPAAFWNIARSDCMGAFLNQSRTQLDPDNLEVWIAAGLEIRENKLQVFRNNNSVGIREDVISFALIWIVSKIVNFVASPEGITASTPTPSYSVDSPRNLAAMSELDSPVTSEISTSRISQWKELQQLLEEWYNALPVTFKPYAVVTAPSKTPNGRSGFQRIFFSIPICAAAIQLYHFAQLLLLLHRPLEAKSEKNPARRLVIFRALEKKCDYHSRQICGIALGDRSLAVGRQLPQALYLAGLCFELHEDRAMVLELLQGIEKNTGSVTAQLVQMLKAQWEWDKVDITA